MSNMKTSIYASINEIAAAEKITRTVLAGLSRDMLIYIQDSQDIEAVNRLLGVLTPMNRKVAILYFAHFLPWEQEKGPDGTFQRFGKKTKKLKLEAKKALECSEWLETESNNIWTWGDANVEIKQKDLAALLGRAIKKALNGDEKSDTPPMSMSDVVKTFIAQGVSVEDLFNGMDEAEMVEEGGQAKVSGVK